MIDDREIWACAAHLLERYGDAAAFHAAQRVDDLILNSDIEGQRTWKRILKKIEELERMAPPTNHRLQ